MGRVVLAVSGVFGACTFFVTFGLTKVSFFFVVTTDFVTTVFRVSVFAFETTLFGVAKRDQRAESNVLFFVEEVAFIDDAAEDWGRGNCCFGMLVLLNDDDDAV